MRREAAGEADGGHDVQVPVGLPLVVGGVEDGLVRAGAGVVDEDVGAAEGGLRGVDEAGAAVGGRHVAGVADGVDAELLGDRGGGADDAVAVAGGEEDVGALAGEGAGDAEADADAAAGDDRYLAGETEVHVRAPGAMPGGGPEPGAAPASDEGPGASRFGAAAGSAPRSGFRLRSVAGRPALSGPGASRPGRAQVGMRTGRHQLIHWPPSTL